MFLRLKFIWKNTVKNIIRCFTRPSKSFRVAKTDKFINSLSMWNFFHLFFLNFPNQFSLWQFHIPFRALNDLVNIFFQWIFIWIKIAKILKILSQYVTFHHFFVFFSHLSKSIFPIRIIYSFRALNCASNHLLNVFLQWILILKKIRQIWRIVFECGTFDLFSDFWKFCKSIFCRQAEFSVDQWECSI